MNGSELLILLVLGAVYLIVDRLSPTYYKLRVFKGNDTQIVYVKTSNKLYELMEYYETKEGVYCNFNVIGQSEYKAGIKKYNGKATI